MKSMMQANWVRLSKRVVLGVAAAGIAACGGGDGSVGVGSGQDPDPVALDFPIAYVKAPVPVVDPNAMRDTTDLRQMRTFNVGADLFVRDRASPSAPETNVTQDITQGLGDIRDVEISSDGERVLFAMRAQFIENADEEDQPTWNIWEYEISTQTLRRVIASDIFAEDGHDVAPHYLPDGRIIFSSTRQRQSKATLLDEGKPQYEGQEETRQEPAFVLHVMNADGSNIRQVSFNQSHDLDPTVLQSGKVMFSRWDGAGTVSGIHLYQMNPDGSDLELIYGANSHDTGTNGGEIHFTQPREMPDGQIMVVARPFTGTDFGGDVFEIDTATYLENTQPTAANAGMAGPAQVPATVNQVRTDLAPSPGGRFASAFPLWDGTDRILIAWTQCRLEENMVIVACDDTRLADPNAVEGPPLYSIWMYDQRDDTQTPVVAPEDGIMITEVVAAQPRPDPAVILDRTPGIELDPDLAAENVGLLHIRSVYDINGVEVAPIDVLADPAQTTADQRPARFIRITKPVPMPDDDTLDFDNSAFGVSNQQLMREILAYAPIEPDGSVMMKVPANVPFAVSILDANGRRITPRHQNWLQVRPGDTLECSGCHDPTTGLSHGRSDAFDSVHDGAQNTGVPWPNTEPALFADFGETMAETRSRVSCATDCAALDPRVDIIYDDVWTDEAVAGRLKDVSFDYRYVDLQTTPPTSAACMLNWTANCRIVINYTDHIHPMWELPRQVLDPNDPNIVLADNTCISCHSTRDAANNLRLPEGQLNLEGAPSVENANHLISYRELLFNDNEQELDMVNMILVDVMIPDGVDPVTGDQLFRTVTVPRSMSQAGANASTTFFSRFDVGGTHAGYLTGAELKLIAEWLDVGAQYYNNPFDAPLN